MAVNLTKADWWLFGVSAVLTAASAITRFVPSGQVLPFIVSALALASLAAVVGRAVDGLGDKLGSGATGVVQSALGNIPELLFGIFALRKGLVTVVEASLVGSILSNVLLMLGLAFIVGGLRHGTQRFSAEGPRMISLLLVLSVGVLIIPTLTGSLSLPAAAHEHALSDIAAIVLLAIFVLAIPASLRRAGSDKPGAAPSGLRLANTGSADRGRQSADRTELANTGSADRGRQSADRTELANTGSADRGRQSADRAAGSERGEGNAPWPLWLAIGLLAVASVAAALVSDWFADALTPALSALHISQAFAGLVIVAIAGNAVENVVGIQLAAKNRMDYALSVMLQSPVQIALGVAPILVLLSAVIGGTQLTLVFPPLMVVSLALTAVVTFLVVNDGLSTWLEGTCLVGLYAVIAAAFWWG